MKRFVAWVINYKKKINKSLTAKTLLVLLTLLLVICAITYTFIILFLPFVNEGQSRNDLNTKSKALVDQLRQCPASKSGELFVCFMQGTGADIYLLDENHKPVDLFTFTVVDKAIQHGQEYPFRFIGSDKEYILSVHFNPIRSEEIKNAIWRSLPWVGGLILVMSLFGAFFFSRYATRPIVRMSKIAANIAELDFSWYCPDLRKDEIGVLAESINELSDKLSVALSSLRHQNSSLENEIVLEKERDCKRLLFFSAVSHELKTPIAIVIGQLEGMLAEIGVYKNKSKYLARSAEILRSLDKFIKEILSVSYIDISDKKVHEPVNLSDVLESTITDSHDLMETRSIKLKNIIEPDVLIMGDAVLLKKALGNVISNSMIYSPNGSSVTIRLTRNQNKINKATLTITNSGAHIDEEHLPHLFEAFYRADGHIGGKYGHGSGLGLYITRMILESHNITHDIENYDEGVMFTAVFHVVNTTHKTHNSSPFLHTISDMMDSVN